MTLYILLGGASILLAILVLVRVYETYTRRVTLGTRLIEKLDPHVLRMLVWGYGRVRRIYGMGRYIMRRFVLPHVMGKVNRVRKRLRHIFEETHHRLEGRRPLRNGGSVNFFLHSVAEHKQLQPERVRTNR